MSAIAGFQAKHDEVRKSGRLSQDFEQLLRKVYRPCKGDIGTLRNVLCSATKKCAICVSSS
jgi:hypothetical protein